MDKDWENLRKELKHEEKPGYRRAFYIILAIGVIYLIVIFVQSSL